MVSDGPVTPESKKPTKVDWKQEFLTARAERDDAEYDAADCNRRLSQLTIENGLLQEENERLRQQISYLEGLSVQEKKE